MFNLKMSTFYADFSSGWHYDLTAAGTRTVIHPKAKIVAEAGPIIIGDYNIIEELVTIANR